MNFRIGLLLCAVFFCNVIFGQDIILDPVTITGTISPQKISKTGRNIIVIKGEAFNNLPVHSIDELLRYLPGVEVQLRGPMGAQSDIVIRGGTFQQVLIIVDGVRVNDPNTGHFNSYIPIAPSEIDRIEILKGASSAIYGSEAVGGVVQVFTKSFARLRMTEQLTNSKELSASVTAGQYNLINANVGGTIRTKKNIFSAGFLTNNADGQKQRGTTGYFYNNTASVSATHFFNDNLKVSLRSSFDKRKFSAQNFYTTFPSDTAKEEVQTLWNQVRVAYQKEKNKFSLDAGYKNVLDVYAFNSAGVPNKNRSALLQATALYEHSFSTKTALVTGAQFQNKTIVSNDRGDHTQLQVAAFVILNKNFDDHFFVSPAIRVDNENGNTEMVPQINLSYKIKNVQLRGSAGKTIRQANFTERYNNYNKTFVAGGSIGNPGLQPERSFSYEAGADYFADHFKFSAGVFRREQANVIDWTPTPYGNMPRKTNLSPTGNYALASNVAKVTTSGVEVDVQYTQKFTKSEQIFTTLGLVWLDSKTSQAVPSFYISSHAKFLINANLQYSNRLFALGVNGIYKRRNPQKATAINAEIDADCFMKNAKADVFFFNKRLSTFVEVYNVFDNRCGDLLGSQLPGRWIMAGISLNLQYK